MPEAKSSPSDQPSRFWLPSRLAAKARRQIVVAILEGAFATRRFYILLALATTIAAFGLLSNSAAVIIGAMIVAPLMGPILGLSLGMVMGRRRLERGALIAEVTGVALAVVLGYFVGLIPLNLGVSAEMLARTSPTAYDLAIAFVSGLAGAYVSVNRSINSTIAGVAISVALVPPLATSGLLMAMGHPREALGAFLLFAANFFCIQLASAFVFGIYGLARAQRPNHGVWPMVGRFAPGIVAIALMSWGMTGTLVGLVNDHSQEKTVRRVLSDEIARRSGGRLDKILKREETAGIVEVVASALTPEVFEPAQVQEIQSRLQTSVHRPVKLVLRSIVSQDIDAKGRVYLTDREREQSEQAKNGAEFLSKATEVLKKGLKEVEGAEVDGLDRREVDGSPLLVALVRTPSIVAPATVAKLEDSLRSELGDDLRLIVRNVSTRDTDRQGFLYVAKPEEAPRPDPEIQSLRSKIRSVLRSRMALQPARFLESMQLLPGGGVLLSKATVLATLPVRPAEVARIEGDLRQFVDPRIRLSIKTILQAEATPSGWTARS